ncbi:hypothetical protein WH367_16470 [Comamonas sp. MYb21]|uniref:hypothetical protein n=1 Tax=Comamonas sp. MYb21 TaxID=1848648 RepID=UPI0030B211A9
MTTPKQHPAADRPSVCPPESAGKPPALDPAKIAALREELIKNRQVPHGVEKDLVDQFIYLHECGYSDDLIPLTPECVLVREQAFKYGRADIVVYHSDGSASVIEAKDGTKGYTHVVAGIGQATLYAVQLGMSKCAVKRVRRCLLWSSTGNHFLDAIIDIACEQAGVISLPMASMVVMQATTAAVGRLLAEARDGGA